jgi:hypothetical protein
VVAGIPLLPKGEAQTIHSPSVNNFHLKLQVMMLPMKGAIQNQILL